MFRNKPMSLAALAGVLAAGPAFGGGFEKSVMWSGHYVGLGGAATSIVDGAESLYFNPAGLGGSTGTEASANFSPTWSKHRGPFLNDTVSETKLTFSPVFGVVGSRAINERLTIGLGAYVSAGTRAIYEGVDVTGNANFASLNPTIKSELSVVEFALGGGYEILDGFKIGAAWRVIKVNADFSSIETTGSGVTTGLYNYTLSGLSATQWNGFKVGMQYAPKDWRVGFGLNWRSEINFDAEGTSSGKYLKPAAGVTTPANFTGGSVTASNAFPMQISFGTFFDVIPSKFRLVGQYDWTHYNRNTQLRLNGTIADAAGTVVRLSSITQGWHNQSNVRFAGEYTTDNQLALRAGYVLTTEVTPRENARPTFSYPGTGHTFTLGAGKSLTPQVGLNGALEYSIGTGTVDATDQAINPSVKRGKYANLAYAAHLGVDVKF